MEQPRSRRSLLFLSHILPEPQDSGAAIRTFNTLRILRMRYDITALCFHRPGADHEGAASLQQRVASLSELADVEAFVVPGAASRVRAVSDHLLGIVRRRPWVWYVYHSTEFRRRIRSLLRQRAFDVIHLDSMDLVGAMALLGGTPKVCVHHNVESQLLERRALAEKAAWRRRYILQQSRRLRQVEADWCPQVDLNVVVSDSDRQQLEGIAPGARFFVFPNGVDVEHYRPGVSAGDGLVFVGGLNWFPNRDALHFFHDQVLPQLEVDGSIPRVRWIGHATADERAAAAQAGVVLTGYVTDERPLVHDAACFVVPLRVGGGTRLKILNAWAMGKAVVSTSIGCEGLAAVHGENILIADTPRDFATAIRSVLTDSELRARLGARGRATAVARYSWSALGESVLQAYRSIEGAPDV